MGNLPGLCFHGSTCLRTSLVEYTLKQTLPFHHQIGESQIHLKLLECWFVTHTAVLLSWCFLSRAKRGSYFILIAIFKTRWARDYEWVRWHGQILLPLKQMMIGWKTYIIVVALNTHHSSLPSHVECFKLFSVKSCFRIIHVCKLSSRIGKNTCAI